MNSNEIIIKVSGNPYRKGDILKLHSNAMTPIKVLKVYDHVWWRKFLIWVKWMNPTYNLKATNRW